jgi:predicted Zn-dependent protease with MMP-like domain
MTAIFSAELDQLIDKNDFIDLSERAYASIPAELRRHVDGVVLKIDDFPDAEIKEMMNCQSDWDLLGLYSGTPIGAKSVSHNAPPADIIFLYRLPILGYAKSYGLSPEEVINHVLIHEIGHHFGLSDADMDAIERRAEHEEETGRQ